MIWFLIPIAYLLGSIPFGLLLTKAVGKGDIRKQGSGNIGATNVARMAGKKLGVLVLLLDAGKGALAVALVSVLLNRATLMQEDAYLYSIAVLCALYTVILGHVFSVWLKFKGGKGVATALGALLALHWPIGVAFIAVWLAVFALTRYVALASIAGMLGALLAPAALYGDIKGAALLAPLFALIVYTHRSNIQRLKNGTEHRFGRS